jgi:hypothetical protein
MAELAAIVSVPAIVDAVVIVCKVRFTEFAAVPPPKVRVLVATTFNEGVASVLFIVIVEPEVLLRVMFLFNILMEFNTILGTLPIVAAGLTLKTALSVCPAFSPGHVEVLVPALVQFPATFQFEFVAPVHVNVACPAEMVFKTNKANNIIPSRLTFEETDKHLLVLKQEKKLTLKAVNV